MDRIFKSCLVVGAILFVALWSGCQMLLEPDLSIEEFCLYLDGYLDEDACLREKIQTYAVLEAFVPRVHTRTQIYDAVGEFKFDEKIGVDFVRDYYFFDQTPYSRWIRGPSRYITFSFNDDGILTGVNYHN